MKAVISGGAAVGIWKRTIEPESGTWPARRLALDPLVNPAKPVIDKDAIDLAVEEHALFFNAHGDVLALADDKLMHFSDRFGEKPDRFSNCFIIDFDDQAAQELIEIVSNRMPLIFANFESESHNLENAAQFSC